VRVVDSGFFCFLLISFSFFFSFALSYVLCTGFEEIILFFRMPLIFELREKSLCYFYKHAPEDA
jgi:hypothetical protein